MNRIILVSFMLLAPLSSIADEKPQPQPGTVTLSLGEYDKLVDQAAKPPKLPEPPPVPAVLSGAEIVARVSGGAARGTVTLNGEIFRKGATELPLVSGATLEPGVPTRCWWSSHEAATTAAERPARYLSDIKTLVTLSEADVRMAALVDITVLQGEPARFELRVPMGFEIAGATGSSLETSEQQADRLIVTARDPALRRHQFLVTLERSNDGGTRSAEVPFPSIEGAQRETGDAAVEGVGTMELKATESDGMQRIDVREAAAPLRNLARQPLLAAFRYQRKGDDLPRLMLEVTRYPDAAVLAAVAELATVTTLVTSEGRALSEVALTVRNQAQPFLKVALPAGATLLSAEVAGEAVKPVKGADGTRVPLLRAGFRPTGPYAVSFVYLQPGTPLGKSGQARIALPAIDIPVEMLGWELFVPDQYKVKDFGGSAVPETVVGFMPAVFPTPVTTTATAGRRAPATMRMLNAGPGELVGRIMDDSGGVLPGVSVTLSGPGVEATQTTGINGEFLFLGVPSATVTLMAELDGFATYVAKIAMARSHSRQVDITLQPATVMETVTVAAEQPIIDTKKTGTGRTFGADELAPTVAPRSSEPAKVDEHKPAKPKVTGAPSSNVLNLQRRVAGVLPVRIEIPRAGTSYRFYRPLVIEEETVVSFAYKKR